MGERSGRAVRLFSVSDQPASVTVRSQRAVTSRPTPGESILRHFGHLADDVRSSLFLEQPTAFDRDSPAAVLSTAR